FASRARQAGEGIRRRLERRAAPAGRDAADRRGRRLSARRRTVRWSAGSLLRQPAAHLRMPSAAATPGKPADEIGRERAGSRNRQETDLIICGLNAFHGDVSVAILRDGALAVAVEEERFTRVKHAAGFPAAALREAVRQAGIDPKAIDAYAVSRQP